MMMKGVFMQAIRKIVTREIFKNFEVPKEFGDRFEMILLPIQTIDNEKLRIENEKSFEEMSAEERWKKFGNWSDEDLKECVLETNRYIFKKMDEEYGEEDYKAWQK